MTDDADVPEYRDDATDWAPINNNAPSMVVARRIVEDHIQHYGMVPYPDRLKEAIARRLRAVVGDKR